MKIGFLGPAYPLRGGIAQFIAILAELLGKQGHDVTIYSFIKQYPKLLFPGQEQVDKSAKVIDLKIKPVLTPYDPLTFPKTIKTILNDKPDLVIFKYWIPFFAPAFGFILAKLKKSGIKTLCIFDNIEFHEKWLFANELTEYVLRSTTECITMSDSVYNSLTTKFPWFPKDKIHKLKHPNYDFYRENELKPKDELKNRLLFFGYIKPYKGLDILLKAMPGIIKANPQLKLTIAGEVYGEPELYTKIIEELKIGEYIDFQNRFIANEEVESFFLNADVCVLPYRTATQSGITQLAFSFCTPVIATDVGGLSEIIQDNYNGYLIDAENPRAIVEAVTRYYSEEKYRQFSANIHHQQQNNEFSWEPFVQTIEKI
ncbi:MAG: glycosyltransferase [Candidatus Cloacimonetes bacterium]|nr:glycosyltransferase [Candidatus Cloacimonadota bacterium]